MNLKRSNLILSLVIIIMSVAEQAKADFVFGEPENLGPAINTPMHEWDPGMSRDGLSLYFQRDQTDWSGVPEAWVAQRATRYDPWDDAVSLGTWSDIDTVIKAVFETMGGGVPGWSTTDDLELYFSDDLLGGYGGWDLFVMKRESVDADWSPPLNLGVTVNKPSEDYSPVISPDGLTLHFASTRPGGYGRTDIWVTTRATRSDPWGTPANLGPTVNSSSWDYNFKISPDGLLLLFASGRPGGFGESDIWMTRRASLSDPWGEVVNLGPKVNTSADDDTPQISPDGSTLYFFSTRPGGYGGFDLWQAPIIPIIDLNTDGIVDSSDMCIVLDHWGEDEPLCDIGPMPWGDGIVDVQDLIVLAEHLFEETTPVE